MPLRVRNLDNSEGGDASKNKFALQYNHSLDRFVLVNVNDLLTKASEDSDIDDAFVTRLEQEINTENITEVDLDGGSF